ncbi:MAG: hypothetical protein J0H75_05025, partial [Rhizobiales bacterium]|nr:hypothetical protein [Hyphomicrobiales bacterium]
QSVLEGHVHDLRAAQRDHAVLKSANETDAYRYFLSVILRCEPRRMVSQEAIILRGWGYALAPQDDDLASNPGGEE